MADTSKVQESSDVFEFYRLRLHRLLDMHGVGVGSPVCLLSFVQRLSADRNLEMDFWALTRSFRHIETEQLSDDQVTATVVECVGGPRVNWDDEEIRPVIEEFEGMLTQMEGAARTGVSSAGLNGSSLLPERRSTFAEPERAGLSDAPLGALIPASPSDSGMTAAISHQLDEALSRLELNSLELKVQLDNLDSRMSRIEPHLEDITSMVASSVGSAGEAGRSSGVRKIPTAVPPRTEFLKPILKPISLKPVRLKVVSVWIGFEAFAKELWAAGKRFANWCSRVVSFYLSRLNLYLGRVNPRPLAVVSGVLVGVLAGGAAIYGVYRHMAGAKAMSPGVVKIADPPVIVPPTLTTPSTVSGGGVVTGPALVVKPGGPGPLATAGLNGKPDIRKADSKADASKVKAVAKHAPATARAVNPREAEVIAPPSFKWLADPAPVGHKEVAPTKSVPDGAARSTPTPVPRAAADTAGPLEPVSVSSDVMATHLLSSNTPTAPRMARLAHQDGPVVLEAVIAKDGTVDRVRVVKGSMLLRHAAEGAALSQRYKPYLVNGKPANVATTITVNFSHASEAK